MAGALGAQDFQSAINPDPPTSEVPAGSGDCAGGIVHDDGTFENGYSGNPALVNDYGIVDLFQPTAGMAYSRVCICFTSFGLGALGMVDVSIYDDNSGGVPSGLLAQESFPVSGVPAFPAGQFYSFDLAMPFVSDGADYVGVRYDPNDFGGAGGDNLFVCADESVGTPPAGGWVELQPAQAWSPTATVFPGCRSMLIRAETSSPTPTVPGSGIALLAAVLVLGALLAMSRRQQMA